MSQRLIARSSRACYTFAVFIQQNNSKRSIPMSLTRSAFALVVVTATLAPAWAEEQGGGAAEEPLARDIVQQCAYKYPGDDQQTRLTIILKDRDGSEKKNVYARYWKDYKGKDGIADKMVLVTEYPPDAKGSVFMRWGYTAGDKNADQWIYLPLLKKTRRVSVRDPGDSFLGSDLTHADISGRTIDADDHKLLKTEKQDENEVFTVESTPRERSGALYSKVVSTFVKPGSDWQGCTRRHTDYFDPRGQLLKQQDITWQRSGEAWLWDEMTVQNVQTGHSSLFRVTDVKTNVGLKDDLFTERNLTRGR
jgi:hypothetical protein